MGSRLQSPELKAQAAGLEVPMKVGCLALLSDQLLGLTFLPISNTKHDARREHADGSGSAEKGSEARERLLLAGVAAEYVATGLAVEPAPRAAEDRSNGKGARHGQKSDAYPPDAIDVVLEPAIQVLVERIRLSSHRFRLSGCTRRTRNPENQQKDATPD